MNRDEQIAMHRKLPITERDLKALNERVTELRRKMPDDEPCTILARLHENGELLWADEAHIEGALLRLEGQTDAAITKSDALGRIAKWLDEAREMGYGSRDIARMLGEVYVGPAPGRAAGSIEELADLLDETANGAPTYEQLKTKAGELFVQAFKLAEQAQELVAPTPDEFNTAIQMVNEMYSDVSEDRPDLGTADGLWDVLEQVVETRRAIAEGEYSA